ncbi:serine/threonine-protein kinase [Sorangium cellulosum]|uniref:serine/threonine-protein kinase n=1 Tax=Sorangium cellulosum TaxID=56 RepID=UPI00041A55DF|nr:serine/threonine-protein kinase [Sorangium cellulosum]
MASADELPAPGALFQGRFLIDRLLGRGGMGEVWAALDTALERPVAIKIIHRGLAAEARYAERFLRETRLAARVAHPNLVRLYDAGRAADGRLFMVMERVSGVPLRQMLANGARLEPVRALHYAIQIADALSTAHEAELVHRDVKPENILVSDGVRARLLDFGVAKDARVPGLTRQGSVVGTSRYMAPEQIAGRAVDGRADLYALGVVIYEMLAGAHPYAVLDEASGIGETEILAAHVHLPATPLPEVLPSCPEALWRAVAACLAKRPEERFARAAELAAALREVARAVVPAERALEDASARQLLSEAGDAARERAIRERGGTGRGEKGAKADPRVAALPVGGAAGGAAAGADARSRLAMAQRFRVEPAWGLSGASAGKGTGTGGDAAGERPRSPALPAEGGAAGVETAGEGAGAAAAGEAGKSPLASTERWEGAAAAGPGEGTLASTEKWHGAAAVLAGTAAGERLARTEPWKEARGGAGVMTARAMSSRKRWGIVVVGVLALCLAALLAVAVVGTVRG